MIAASPTRWRRALRLAASAATLLAIVACGSAEPGAGPNEAEQARSDALRALEAHLGERVTYGEGPDAEALAREVREALAPEDGVAVRIVPGDPRSVVVLVRYRSTGGYQDLREISVPERNEEIDRIVDAIDQSYGARSERLAVAIRGTVFYGAVGVREPGQPMQYHTGSVVNLAVIDPILTATPAEDPPIPAFALGAQIEGTVPNARGPFPSHQLTLSEETLVVTQLVAADTRDAPFVSICRTLTRPTLCAEPDVIEPVDGFQNDGLDELAERLAGSGRALDYDAYRLPAGTYAVAVLPNCDSVDSCSSAGTRYTLLATTPRAR